MNDIKEKKDHNYTTHFSLRFGTGKIGPEVLDINKNDFIFGMKTLLSVQNCVKNEEFFLFFKNSIKKIIHRKAVNTMMPAAPS